MPRACVIALFWVTFFSFPLPPAGPALDPSWSESLGRGILLDYQCGVDTVLTYGPLGYYQISHYVSELYWSKIIWECFIKLYMAVVFAIFLFRLGTAIHRIVFFFMFVCLSLVFPESMYFLLICGTALLVAENVHRHPAIPCAGLAFLFLIGLVKFTFFVTAAGCILVILLSAWREVSIFRALRLGAVGFLILILLWSVAGQSVWNLPAYVWNSIAIASGYNEGMASKADPSHIGCALSACLGFFLLNFAWTYAGPDRRKTLAKALICCGVLFVMWKHGFVRQDLHRLGFFCFAACVPLLIWRDACTARGVFGRLGALSGCFTIAMSLAGLFSLGKEIDYGPEKPLARWNEVFAGNLKNLAELGTVRRGFEEMLEARRRDNALPGIRREIGRESADMISYEQAVLFLNGLNWKPRPVFQSYSAYTPALIRMNAGFYRGLEAPKYVVFKLQTVDGRFPTLDDSDALKVLFQAYEPVLEEKGYLLWKRRAAGAIDAPPVNVLLERVVKFGERVDISGLEGRNLILEIHVDSSLTGSLRSFFYQAATIFIEMEGPSGSYTRFRIIPDMARTGFLIHPYIPDQSCISAPFLFDRLPKIAAFRLVPDVDEQRLFQEEIRIRVLTVEGLIPPPDEKKHAWLAEAGFPMLKTKPHFLSGSFRPVEPYCGTGLMVHAPGEMWFRTGRGKFEMSGRFGMEPNSYTKGDTDGVCFKIEVRSKDGRGEVVFQRDLKPKQRPGDQGTHSFRIAFEAPSDADVVFKTEPGESLSWDWSFWDGVEIARNE